METLSSSVSIPGQGEREADGGGLRLSSSQLTLTGLCVSWSRHEVYYLSLRPDGTQRESDDGEVAPDTKLRFADRLQAVTSVLCAPSKATVVAFDIKDVCCKFYRATGHTINCESHDPKVAAWLLSPDDKERSFERLVSDELPELCRRGNDALFYLATAPQRPARLSAAAKAVLSFQLMDRLLPSVEKEGLFQPFTDTEMLAVLCFARMELCGLGADRDKCAELRRTLQQRMEELEEQAYGLVGHSFALTSPQVCESNCQRHLIMHLHIFLV